MSGIGSETYIIDSLHHWDVLGLLNTVNIVTQPIMNTIMLYHMDTVLFIGTLYSPGMFSTVV